MKKSEAAELVMMLIAAFPQAKTTDRTSQVYETMLVDIDAAAARAAVHRLIATSRWMPTVAEIRAICAAQTHGAARSGEEAYAEVLAAVRVHGRDYGQGAPKFRDPIIARCIGVWGAWNDLCSSPSDDPGGRARFVELYDDLATRGRQDLAAGQSLPSHASVGPAFWLDAPRAAKAEAKPSSVALARTAPPPAPDPARLRKWTPAELDAELSRIEAAQ
jgi:hypothetical protein